MIEKRTYISINDIKDAIKNPLPGKLAHYKMIPNGRSLEITLAASELINDSAVLVLIFPDNNELNICLVLRNSNLKNHPGQICFPGGKSEKHETQSSETALREAEEEIGISANKIEIIGYLTDIYISVSNFLIHPVLAYINYKPIFKINDCEVERLIILPLRHFLVKKNKAIEKVNSQNGYIEVPCFKIGNDTIWGQLQ